MRQALKVEPDFLLWLRKLSIVNPDRFLRELWKANVKTFSLALAMAVCLRGNAVLTGSWVTHMCADYYP